MWIKASELLPGQQFVVSKHTYTCFRVLTDNKCINEDGTIPYITHNSYFVLALKPDDEVAV